MSRVIGWVDRSVHPPSRILGDDDPAGVLAKGFEQLTVRSSGCPVVEDVADLKLRIVPVIEVVKLAGQTAAATFIEEQFERLAHAAWPIS